MRIYIINKGSGWVGDEEREEEERKREEEKEAGYGSLDPLALVLVVWAFLLSFRQRIMSGSLLWHQLS